MERPGRQTKEAQISENTAGRQAETSEAPKPRKRGARSWAPENPLHAGKVPAGMHPRWVAQRDTSISRRLDQGFVFANPETGWAAKPKGETDRFQGAPTRGGDLVLMVLPEEDHLSYREFIAERTAQATRNVQNPAVAQGEARREVGDALRVHGSVQVIQG